MALPQTHQSPLDQQEFGLILTLTETWAGYKARRAETTACTEKKGREHSAKLQLFCFETLHVYSRTSSQPLMFVKISSSQQPVLKMECRLLQTSSDHIQEEVILLLCRDFYCIHYSQQYQSSVQQHETATEHFFPITFPEIGHYNQYNIPEGDKQLLVFQGFNISKAPSYFQDIISLRNVSSWKWFLFVLVCTSFISFSSRIFQFSV